MYENSKVVVIIPARGGSKRLPRKNIFTIWGRPMLYWAITAAKNSSVVDEVWVTTEDSEIKAIALECGAKVHDRRPELSGDRVYKMEAIRECFRDIDNGEDIVISLQANSPQITGEILDKAVSCFVENDRNELFSVDSNLMMNAAFRIMSSWYVYQKDLSTKAGVFVADLLDVHTIEDVRSLEAVE